MLPVRSIITSFLHRPFTLLPFQLQRAGDSWDFMGSSLVFIAEITGFIFSCAYVCVSHTCADFDTLPVQFFQCSCHFVPSIRHWPYQIDCEPWLHASPSPGSCSKSPATVWCLFLFQMARKCPLLSPESRCCLTCPLGFSITQLLNPLLPHYLCSFCPESI